MHFKTDKNKTSIDSSHKQKDDISFNISKTELNAQERERLLEFLTSNMDVFATSLDEIGLTPLIEHAIDIRPDAVRFQNRPYRTSPGMKQIIEEEIQKLLDADLIEPSCSPFCSPVVMVKKLDNTYRMCVDYRMLNSITIIIMYFHLPEITEIIDSMGTIQPKIFTVLDCFQGCIQVGIKPSDRYKTSFITHLGQFNYKRMAFGLKKCTFHVSISYEPCFTGFDV